MKREQIQLPTADNMQHEKPRNTRMNPNPMTVKSCSWSEFQLQLSSLSRLSRSVRQFPMSWANKVKSADKPAPPASQASSSPQSFDSKSALNFIFSFSRGLLARVQLKDKSVYEGVLMSSKPSGNALLVTLGMCQKLNVAEIDGVPSCRSSHPFSEQQDFSTTEIVQIRVMPPSAAASSNFKTDGQIGARDFAARTLTRFVAEVDESGPIESLESVSLVGFDQFKRFEQMSGKKADFDVNKFANTLDQNSSEFRQVETRSVFR